MLATLLIADRDGPPVYPSPTLERMRRRRDRESRIVTSWTGGSPIVLGGSRRGRLDRTDALIVAVVLALYDFVALLVVGIVTAAKTSLCTPAGCDPGPARQVHVAFLGLCAFVVVVALPPLIALVLRRGLLTTLIAQVLAAAVMLPLAAHNLGNAHANLRQICGHSPPPSVAVRCPSLR
jgi:hypothetical protein